jgi:hypothetical protein
MSANAVHFKTANNLSHGIICRFHTLRDNNKKKRRQCRRHGGAPPIKITHQSLLKPKQCTRKKTSQNTCIRIQTNKQKYTCTIIHANCRSQGNEIEIVGWWHWVEMFCIYPVGTYDLSIFYFCKMYQFFLFILMH